MNKKVLMVTDLEGISGISKIEQVMETEDPDYIHSREYLMADVNAAIAGCFDGGADAVFNCHTHCPLRKGGYECGAGYRRRRGMRQFGYV